MNLNDLLEVKDGILFYKDGTKVTATSTPAGYIQVSFKNPVPLKSTVAHRVIYFLCCGVWSDRKNQIDHIDGNKANNKIENLRLISRAQNQRHRTKQNKNNTSSEANIQQINNNGYIRYRVTLTRAFENIEDAKTYRDAIKKFGQDL
jgi:hypothetical protein